MKVIPIALQAELNKSVARLALCIRIVRRDLNVYCFTTSRKSLVVDGETYLPAASFNPTDIASNSNLDVDDLEVEAMLSSAYITEDDIRAGRWDYASFRVFRVNWASSSDGVEKLRAGNFGEIKVNRQTFVSQMLGLMDAYTTVIGKKTQPGCRTSLGTTECGVTPTVVTGTILLCETDFFTLTDPSRTEPDAFFDEGVITFTSGLATGLSYEIKAYILVGSPGGGLFVTKTAVAYDVTAASYTMSEGCTRRFQEDCVGRFSNGDRFRGEPWLRGPDAAIQVGRHV